MAEAASRQKFFCRKSAIEHPTADLSSFDLYNRAKKSFLAATNSIAEKRITRAAVY